MYTLRVKTTHSSKFTQRTNVAHKSSEIKFCFISIVQKVLKYIDTKILCKNFAIYLSNQNCKGYFLRIDNNELKKKNVRFAKYKSWISDLYLSWKLFIYILRFFTNIIYILLILKSEWISMFPNLFRFRDV